MGMYLEENGHSILRVLAWRELKKQQYISE
jgi:hypothetical protein